MGRSLRHGQINRFCPPLLNHVTSLGLLLNPFPEQWIRGGGGDLKSGSLTLHSFLSLSLKPTGF